MDIKWTRGSGVERPVHIEEVMGCYKWTLTEYKVDVLLPHYLYLQELYTIV